MNRRSSIPILAIAGLALLLTVVAQHFSPDPPNPHDIALEELLELKEELRELRMSLDDDTPNALHPIMLDPPFPPEYSPPYPPELDLNRQ